MAKRLYMTSADYLAIAVSPALIMALVGSLVFFLLEVFYQGDYQARLNYVFALFVFAAVLIARISIEMGSERAVMYGLPLAGAVYLVVLKFVEHPSIFSPLFNLLLIAIVWYCAHKLTWDCTLIDDDEDASGEGLMQRLGVDDDDDPPPPDAKSATPKANELASDDDHATNFWQRLTRSKRGPHTPGIWVLYFSLAALPLFGIGNGWISDDAGRSYAFSLLFIYVAAGLGLLVTTSFLGFRRYLRQREVEMPMPMAMTWVSVGGALILVVMILAMLLPRPEGVHQLAQLPWQLGSPDGLRSSKVAFGNDGAKDEENQPDKVVSDDPDAPTGDKTDDKEHEETASGENGNKSGGEQKGEGDQSGSEQSQSENNQSGQGENKSDQGESGDSSESSDRDKSQSSEQQSGNRSEQPSNSQSEQGQQNEQDESDQSDSQQSSEDNAGDEPSNENSSSSSESSQTGKQPMPEHTSQPNQPQFSPSQLFDGISNLFKLIFYLLFFALLAYFCWKYRKELAQAFRDIVREIKAFLARLFGREPVSADAATEEAPVPQVPRPRFSSFQNPFESGTPLPAGELVRYTFLAFEAWCDERGVRRTADQTPYELSERAAERGSDVHRAARHLAALYNRLAYSGGSLPTSEVAKLAELWRLMGAAEPVTAGSSS